MEAVDPSPSALTDEQAHAVVTFAPDGIVVVDHHGVIVSANARLGALFGYHIDELVGSPIERLVPEALRGEHRSHRDRFGANPSVRTMGVGRTLLGRCKDGSELSVEVGLSPMPGPSGVHVVGIVRDVTEQTALRSANELIQQAIDASRDGVYMFDPKSLVFTYVNQGAVDQTGYTRAQLLSMSPLDMNAEFTEATFRQLLRPLLDGDRESVEFETVHRRVDGGDVPVEVVLQWPAVTAHSRDAAARPLLAIARNIGERKVAEADRRRLARQTALISRLRLLLLGDQPAVPVELSARRATDRATPRQPASNPALLQSPSVGDSGATIIDYRGLLDDLCCWFETIAGRCCWS